MSSEVLTAWRKGAVARAVIGVVVVAEAVTQLVIARQVVTATGGHDDLLPRAGTVAVASYVATVLLALLLVAINGRALSAGPSTGLHGPARFVAWTCGLRLPLLVALLVGSGALAAPVGVGLLLISGLDAVLCLLLAMVTSSALRRPCAEAAAPERSGR